MNPCTLLDRSESGSAMLISLILLVLLAMLGATMLSVSGVESGISHNERWSEAAFHSAEAGIHAGIDQLSADPVAATQPILETTIADGYSYRSGGRLAAGPQPMQFVGTRHEAGFSIDAGTGYNPTGYTFLRYRVNATGVGPRNTRRQVEVLARYGPVAE